MRAHYFDGEAEIALSCGARDDLISHSRRVPVSSACVQHALSVLQVRVGLIGEEKLLSRRVVWLL